MLQLHTPRMSRTEGNLVISVASRVTYWERAEIARVQVAALEQRFEAEEHRGQRPKKSFLSDHNRAHLRCYRMKHNEAAERTERRNFLTAQRHRAEDSNCGGSAQLSQRRETRFATGRVLLD